MIKIKEKNFISAVLYVRNNEKNIVEILEKLDNKLFEYFSSSITFPETLFGTLFLKKISTSSAKIS